VAQRIKGQDTAIQVLAGPAGAPRPQFSLSDLRNFEVAFVFDISQEGYLGEKSDRYDETYKGFRGSMELHAEDAGIFNFIQLLADRARRRGGPIAVINVNTTLQFPNGNRPRVAFRDCSFGEIPLGFTGRADFVTMKLDFKGSDFPTIL
jgi:hypothetical protein